MKGKNRRTIDIKTICLASQIRRQRLFRQKKAQAWSQEKQYIFVLVHSMPHLAKEES